MSHNINECIRCTVSQCAHHAGDADYCALSKIEVSTHEMNPTQVQCTDCMSFERK